MSYSPTHQGRLDRALAPKAQHSFGRAGGGRRWGGVLAAARSPRGRGAEAVLGQPHTQAGTTRTGREGGSGRRQQQPDADSPRKGVRTVRTGQRHRRPRQSPSRLQQQRTGSGKQLATRGGGVGVHHGALSRATLKYPWKNFGKLHRANFLSLARKKWEEKNSANKAFEMLNSNSLGKTASK